MADGSLLTAAAIGYGRPLRLAATAGRYGRQLQSVADSRNRQP